MTEAFSPRLRAIAKDAAAALGTRIEVGVYAGLAGPQYETPAEVCLLRTLGADAVGMSTVPEAIQAKALGLEVAGFSCLTNFGAGMIDASLDHEEVMETGAEAAGKLVDLLEAGFS